jgi:RND family efflux transporter MFP subunit
MYKFLVVIPFLAMAMACNNTDRTGSAAADDVHQHSGADSQYTLFSEHLEFFITHQALEAGVETEFLIHLTRLENYKPCSAGNVSISIDGVTVTSGPPATPGIFKIPFIPKKEGAFHADFTFKNGDEREHVEGHVHIYADHDAIHGEEAASSGHSHGPETEGEISFSKESAWNNKFMVKQVNPGPFRSSIATSGEIVSMPGEKKNVTSSFQGIVRFADSRLVQGTPVKKGQLLFTLSSENLLEDNVLLRYEEARNRLEKSRSQYQRHQALYTQQVIPLRQYQESRTSYVEDSLRYYSLANNISEGVVRVFSPVSGTIHELKVSDGEYSQAGQILAILSTNRNLMLRADLPQQHFGQLELIETAHFRPAYSKRVFTVEEMSGSLLAAGVSVAENNHYLPVIFRLENDGNLLEGAFAEVYLLSSEKREVLSIPSEALHEEQGGHYVYVQITGESYSKRYVSTGQHNGLKVEITQGLEAGDRVVTEGTTLVKAASMATGEIGHGHSH